MIEVWIAILFCENVAQCSPNANTQFLRTQPTQALCEQAGIEFMRTAGVKISENRVVVCVKGVKPS